jgi:hypothetical protein
MLVSELFEARNPKLTYTEKQVKKVLDRVTVELTGNESGVMSRLTTRYSRLDKAAKLMQEKRNALNEEMKQVAESLFDAQDEVLTRVVDTVSYTITLSKAEKAESKSPTKKVDYSAVVKELAQMLPELQEKIDQITEQYTEIIQPKDTPVKLIVKSKLDEGFTAFAKSLVKSFKEMLKSIKSWGKDYDKRLAALKKQTS